LQPFSGWWIPPEEIRHFLTAPWPRYITLEDVLINIAAYVPLGFLFARALMPRLRTPRAVLSGAALACLTSVMMEAAQMFIPARVASNVDVLANGIGGLIGALAAPLFSPTRGLGMRLKRVRSAWFVYGPGADVGLVLLGLWLVTQLHPTAQLFGTGNLRDTFDVPGWIIHTPHLQLAAEAAVAGFNVLGLGLVVFALTRKTAHRPARGRLRRQKLYGLRDREGARPFLLAHARGPARHPARSTPAIRTHPAAPPGAVDRRRAELRRGNRRDQHRPG
jgi:VanZ family protein